MLVSIVAVFAGRAVISQETKSDGEDKNERLQAVVEESVKWYELLPDADSETAMQPLVALRWRNASRGQKGEDLLVLWNYKGRPQAAASLFPWGAELCHEFVSLSRETTLIAKDQTAVVWSPSEPGVEFHDVPDAARPAASEAARLREMKSIPQQFAVTMTGWKADDSDREEMRLLPRPLYRYALKNSNDSHPDLQDGAVFAFVQGTDPEALLLLESVGSDERHWQYAFARGTSGGLEARLADSVVWTAEKYPSAPQERQKPQIYLRRFMDQ